MDLEWALNPMADVLRKKDRFETRGGTQREEGCVRQAEAGVRHVQTQES